MHVQCSKLSFIWYKVEDLMLMPLPSHNFPAYNKQASMSRILSFLCIPYSIQIAEITKYHLSLRKKGGNSMEEVHPFS